MDLYVRNSLIALLFLWTGACVTQGDANPEAFDSAPGTSPGVAVVNGVAIPDAAFDEAARRLAEDRREPISEADRAQVVDRLIDEELLVQYGLDQGFARDDRRVRSAIVASVMEREKSFPCFGDCTGDELREFYEDRPELFRATARVAIRTMWFSDHRPETQTRAREALAELRAGSKPEEIAARLADDDAAPPPNAPMPPDKLADYIGITAARVAESMPEGSWSDPIAVAGGVRLIFVASREAGKVNPFEQVEDQIRFEAQRFAHERAVQKLIADLRAKANIEVARDTSKGDAK
ncbi:MAG: peptidyl-prolyl cis-trans isomerase [Deltaproteobacteria bacterium]|nr:peptidyl-prolyl cis-trans isomerase [Deltaproteobacteria bacterium]